MTRDTIMEEALMDIAGAHTPAQPAASGCDEATWVMQHVGNLRRLARNALDKIASAENARSEWQDVCSGVSRMPVPGGWIYNMADNVGGSSSVFVPKEDTR